MNLISMLSKQKSWLPQTEMGLSIPKIIHQTFSDRNLPSELQENIAYIKKNNPDWQYKLYDDTDIENFINQHYPYLLKIYKKINPNYGAARADFFRYLVMYKEGGLYLDIKSSALKPLDQIIQPSDTIILSHWPDKKEEKYYRWGRWQELSHYPNGEIQQWFILSVPGHPFLHAVISQIIDNILTYDGSKRNNRSVDVLCVTGPIAFTLAIEPLLSSFPHRFSQNSELGLVYSIYENIDVVEHRTLFKTHYSTLQELQEPVVLNIKSLIDYRLRKIFRNIYRSFPIDTQNWIKKLIKK